MDVDDLFELLALERGDRSLEELTVESEADGGDVPRLLRTEQVASAAEFEVTDGEVEARAESAMTLERRKALAGIGVDESVLRQQENRVPLFRGASDASAQLIEVGETEGVGLIDEDRVGARNVDAGFDDGR